MKLNSNLQFKIVEFASKIGINSIIKILQKYLNPFCVFFFTFNSSDSCILMRFLLIRKTYLVTT